MEELTDAQKARHAIREFKTITDALVLRGFYRLSGKLGRELESCLNSLSPEIYGSMNDPRIVELKGLEYVLDRLPRGIEECNRIILTEEDPFENTNAEKIGPYKRRRTAYRVSDNELCIVISRGLSEIYDILTHLTFLYSEARKIFNRMKTETDMLTLEWRSLEKTMAAMETLDAHQLDQALWNLSIILGRPYQETRDTYDYLEKSKKKHSSNNGLFSIIFQLGKRIDEEKISGDDAVVVYLTPSLVNIIGRQKYGIQWAGDIKDKIRELNLLDRPLHIISANLHSTANLLYGYTALKGADPITETSGRLYDFCHQIRDMGEDVIRLGKAHGLYELTDRSGTHINCQLIDTALLDDMELHPDINLDLPKTPDDRPVLVVMDYAFGAQAFELMENILRPYTYDNTTRFMNIKSISIMGKAGILTGNKGDIMLATAHVFEGTSDNYIFENELKRSDFSQDMDVYEGPMVTVLGTSLQNRDMLEKFQSDWKTVGLEMEGGHYQRAIGAAIIKGNISQKVSVRYAYYASDNPLATGNTLAAGTMGKEGIKPAYMITKAILEKIFRDP
ncbi:MAG: hypothetical protein DRH90_15380 [Deltaproteobacteria bacterium]|nr:MAG: hypothetical protein DRH90_15380 [Deltaproteobacteria bacterium]